MFRSFHIKTLKHQQTTKKQLTLTMKTIFLAGFMLNVCTALLQFYLPISQSLEKLEKVDLGYSASPACRFSYNFEACLAGGQISEYLPFGAVSSCIVSSCVVHLFVSVIIFNLVLPAINICDMALQPVTFNLLPPPPRSPLSPQPIPSDDSRLERPHPKGCPPLGCKSHPLCRIHRY